jgi:predicted O-methyltransferase YrrM
MRLRDFLSQNYRRLDDAWKHYRGETGLPGHVPRGHYYSALPDIDEGARYVAKISECPPRDGLLGLNLQIPAQHELLLKMCGLYPEFDWAAKQTPERRFHFNQGYYLQADGICLYSMLRLFRPKRVIEVGSGFSSALMLDVNDHFLDRQTHFTFVEPYPDRLESILRSEDKASVCILRQPVQVVPPDTFKALHAGDFLFIDSSHISKVGSDVNYLLFDILPKLPIGVFVHVHDIYWPFEYAADWIREGHSWNEAYVVRAFLSFNEAFEIVFWTPLAARLWPEIIKERMPTYMINTGAALWFRRMR